MTIINDRRTEHAHLNIQPGDQIGRLAMRREGGLWVAYYAKNDTMDGAILLGSIVLKATLIPERKLAFMDLMREVVADIIEEVGGKRPVWGGPVPAPEHEKGGAA